MNGAVISEVNWCGQMAGRAAVRHEEPIRVSGLGKRTSPRTFSRPFEAIRQFVENSKAVGASWNAQELKICLEEGDTKLVLVDDGQGARYWTKPLLKVTS